jgi:hypothetical protein
MYLGMQLIIIAVIFKLGNDCGFNAVPFFILYITQFQTKPEEGIIERILVNSICTIKRRLDAVYRLAMALNNQPR